MAVRNIMSRSSKKMRVKFPSRKNQRMVFCESTLEHDVARWLELDPLVVSFREQPSRETYYDEAGKSFTYFPDFEAVMNDDSVLHIEVKPASKLNNPALRYKYELIANRYCEQDRAFRIVTDEFIRVEPFAGNLKLLHSHYRRRPEPNEISDLLAQLGKHVFHTFSDVAQRISIKSVFRLLALGILQTDVHIKIDMNSPVWLDGGRTPQ